jgi:DNA invertase Pin-like site-specific DNA recombinase
VVTVTRIDRLARSIFDLFSIVKQIVHKGGQFRSLAGPWADTATSTGRLMIAVLGGLADVERDRRSYNVSASTISRIAG